MTEKELIAKIRELRQIKPKREWVVLTKSQILGKEITPERFLIFNFPVWRLAYVSVFVVFILFGMFGFTQNSLPGDLFYPIKKITEKVQVVFVSEEEKPKVSLELTNKRLEELEKIAQTNQVENLAPAVNEFQKNISEAAKNLARIESSDPKEVKRFIDSVKEIKNKVKKIESYGVVIGEKGLEEFEEATTKLKLQATIQVLKDAISQLEISLEKGALTKEKEEMLIKIKELMEAGKYSEALELYLVNQNQ